MIPATFFKPIMSFFLISVSIVSLLINTGARKNLRFVKPCRRRIEQATGLAKYSLLAGIQAFNNFVVAFRVNFSTNGKDVFTNNNKEVTYRIFAAPCIFHQLQAWQHFAKISLFALKITKKRIIMKKVYDFAYEKCVCACVCVCASARVNFNVAVSFITIRQHINCFVSNVFFLHLNLSEQTLTLSHFALAPRPAPKRKYTQYENWFSPRPSVWQVYS